MRKEEREYLQKYGDVPIDANERYDYLVKQMKRPPTSEIIQDFRSRIKSIKWKTLKYTLYVIPKGTPRPRLGKRGVFYVQGAADNKRMMKSLLEDVDIPLIKTAVKFTCDSYMPIPHGMTNTEKLLAELKIVRPLTIPDFDNLAKGYCDMLQGLLIANDSQVIDGRSRKYYSAKPRVEITISYMEDFDSNFNRKKFIER